MYISMLMYCNLPSCGRVNLHTFDFLHLSALQRRSLYLGQHQDRRLTGKTEECSCRDSIDNGVNR